MARILFLLFCAAVCSMGQTARFADEILQIMDTLTEHFNQDTSYDRLNQLLSNLTESSKGEELNGCSLVQFLAKMVGTKLEQMESQLNKSVDAAEQSYLSRHQSPCCDCLNTTANPVQCKSSCKTNYIQSTVAYIRVQNESISEMLEFEYSQLFERNVSFDDSAVHVPVDIPSTDPRVICFVDWTQNFSASLIARSREKMSEDDGISYQYFGSAQGGALRFYPATQWEFLHQCHRCPLPPVDTYHANERPWYLHTMSGSKSMAIVLDLSGSMSGFRLLLAQLTIVQLLQQVLTPADYFYVVGSKSEEGVNSSPFRCSMNLTRASAENVLAMTEVIRGYSNRNLSGRANFNDALDLVFDEFNRSKVNTCHELVMVFTDHDSDPNELRTALESLNTRQARVFTFLVGPSTAQMTKNQLNEIACQNGGTMTHIQYYNDVHEQIAEFTDQLRKRISTSTGIFWNKYRDVFGSYVLTGSLPLLIEDEDGLVSDFVGVAGIDLNLAWLRKKLLSMYQITESYYSFIIDDTGELLFHPLLNKEFISTASANDLLKFDVRHYEHPVNETEFDGLLRAMLNGETGNGTLEAWIPLQKENRYIRRNVTYYYTRINNTQFTITVVGVNNQLQGAQRFNVTSMIESLLESEQLLSSSVFLVTSDKTLCGTSTSCQPVYDINYSLSSLYNFSVLADSTRFVLLRPLNGFITLGQVLKNQSALRQNLSAILQSTSNEFVLFLLDLNAYLVASGQEHQTGQHFSEIFPSILEDLVSRNVYSKGLIRGYELQPCETFSSNSFTGCSGSAFSMYKGFLVSLGNLIIYTITDGLWLTAKLVLLSIMTSIESLFKLLAVQAQEETSSHSTLTGMMTSQANKSEATCPVKLCLKQFVAYELHATPANLENITVSCSDGGDVVYDTFHIEATSLLLLSVSSNCSESSTDNQDDKYEIPCPCDNYGDNDSTYFHSQCKINSTTMGFDCSNGATHSKQLGYILALLSGLLIYWSLL